MSPLQGRIQDFKLGWAHLKKLRQAEAGEKIFWGISCEKSRLYAKKSYFSNFRGRGRAPGAPPPLNPPLLFQTTGDNDDAKIVKGHHNTDVIWVT